MTSTSSHNAYHTTLGNCSQCVICRFEKRDLPSALQRKSISVLTKVIPYTTLSHSQHKLALATFVEELSAMDAGTVDDEEKVEAWLDNIASMYVGSFYWKRLQARQQSFHQLQWMLSGMGTMEVDSDDDDQYHDGELVEDVQDIYAALQTQPKTNRRITEFFKVSTTK